ncbi:MAG: phosphoglucosamine mutase [Bacteroidales bacterium]|jgi:phosphomannomutase|nr:phosphoglucosamine mutase [Bacteroidales bacterium]
MPLIKSISGIRGTIGDTPGEDLTPTEVVKFTFAFVQLIKSKQNSKLKILVGRDARVSGEVLNYLVCNILLNIGVDVIDVGFSTTPSVEMAVVKHKADGGIILTASHNPMEWNALKLLNEKGEFISAAEGQLLLKIAENIDGCVIRELTNPKGRKMFAQKTLDIESGSYTRYHFAIEDHIDEILKLEFVNVKAIRSACFSVVIDAINSTGGIAIPLLLEKLGVEKVKVLNAEPTGIFSHNPEPLPEHLHEISSIMNSQDFDVGFVVDPDVDRLAIVMENGEMFGEEYTLVAIADYVLQHKKGNTVSNLSSTRALCDVSKKHGVAYSASAVGEVNVVEKMKETNAIIGGEGNGGIIFPELHYGRDALVGIALFLTFMAKTKKKCSEIKKMYPNYYISKNRIEITKTTNVQEILQKVTKKFANNNPIIIDGVKIDFEQGWVHLRPSNTEPIIRIYAEAKNETETENLINEVKNCFL